MQEKIKDGFLNIWDKWKELEMRKKIQLISAVVVVVAALGAVIFFSTRPKMRILVDNLNTATLTEITKALDAANISYDLNDYNDAVLVNDKDYKTAKRSLATLDLSGVGGFTFLDALDVTSMSSTQKTTDEALKRAFINDLEATIEGFKGVAEATVQLNQVDDTNYFLEPNQTASASVLIKQEVTGGIKFDGGHAIAMLMQKSVKGLSLENVYVTDTDFNVLFSGEDQASDTFKLNSERDIELAWRSDLSRQIQSSVGPAYASVKIVMNLKFDWDKINSKKVTFESPLGDDSATGLIKNEKKENQTVQSGNNDAEPGLPSNNNVTPTYPTDNGTSQSGSSKSSDTEYLHNTYEEVKESGVGTVLTDSSNISVFAYRFKDYYEAELEANGKLAGTNWFDFKQSKGTDPVVIENDATERIQTSLRNGTGIEGLTFQVYEINRFIDKEVVPVKVEQYVIFFILALLIVLLALGLIRRTKTEEETQEDVEPELSVEQLLVSTQLEEQKEKESDIEKLQEIEMQKENEVKKQIEKFIDEKPDAVASLLRNWLSDEWD